MIVRSPFKCGTCGQIPTVRIGMGQETRQTHRFPCSKCGEDMVVALNVDYQTIAYWTEGIENAALSDAATDAPIVNVEANFVVPEGERHVDFAFPRLQQLHGMNELAVKHGSLAWLTEVPAEMRDQRPYRRPDYVEEWRLLKKVWSLYRRGQDELSRKRLEGASTLLYKADPLRDLLDWLFRFTSFVSQPHYEASFLKVVEILRLLLPKPEFAEFAAHYNQMVSDRSARYFELMRAYFEGYADFGQVHFYVADGRDLPAGGFASSMDFDATRMFYGNAFEAFASLVDVLAYLNNLLAGRAFAEFETLTQKQYLKLDKANRFDAFASNRPFAALCEERDNQLRNASHHGELRLDRKTQTIRYRAGKGGNGPQQAIGYAVYLARCSKIFLQAMTLLRIEIVMCHASGARPPLL
jgi:hypothetical protein